MTAETSTSTSRLWDAALQPRPSSRGHQAVQRLGRGYRVRTAALTDERFFALDIDRSTAAEVYKRVRNRLSHNAILAKETVLMPGAPSAPPIVQKDGHVVVNLVALLERTRAAVEKLASSPATYISPDAGARAAFDAKPTQNREGWQYLSTFSAAASGCAPLDHH